MTVIRQPVWTGLTCFSLESFVPMIEPCETTSLICDLFVIFLPSSEKAL